MIMREEKWTNQNFHSLNMKIRGMGLFMGQDERNLDMSVFIDSRLCYIVHIFFRLKMMFSEIISPCEMMSCLSCSRLKLFHQTLYATYVMRNRARPRPHIDVFLAWYTLGSAILVATRYTKGIHSTRSSTMKMGTFGLFPCEA